MHSGHPSNSTTNPNHPDRPIDRLDRPGPSTTVTRPAHRPIGLPLSHPTLALGLRALGAPAPPPGPCFLVFAFCPPPAWSRPPGRVLTERSKPFRQGHNWPPRWPNISTSVMDAGPELDEGCQEPQGSVPTLTMTNRLTVHFRLSRRAA